MDDDRLHNLRAGKRAPTRKAWPCALTAALLLAPTPAFADDERKSFWRDADRCAKRETRKGTPEVPGGDIFGFTSPTDIGDACTFSYGADLIGRSGKQDGRHLAGTAKFQFGYTFSDSWSFALSPFLSAFSWRDVSSHRDVLRSTGVGSEHSQLKAMDFDGLSGEATWRILSRSPYQPLAVAVSIEPRAFRRDGANGHRAEGQQIEFKLFADLALSDRWFAAVNAVYGVGRARLMIDAADRLHGSAAAFSAATTYQIYSDEGARIAGLFFGAELRHVRAFDGFYFNTREGAAWLAGPTLAAQLKGGQTLSLVWTPQIVGHTRKPATPRTLDLETCERHQFKVKFAATF